ncbi:MAG: cysteine--tRNA ligase [Cyanobacteria bacterium MAG IRC4_bin_6]|nr:cysteine--tRNA ligase [Cyanobacteria bacterium MAG IRC3_bin_20]MDE0646745.1 cysteine--tRNA ligase [Cyanobacteria bacterium MAG IRC4_bin_6]
MVLRLHNTLTGRQEVFTPRHPPAVSIYCCGVTVYDACHLGHARSYIAWDLLRRYLRWQGFAVRFIQNFTDIDDKIIQRAEAEGSSVEVVTERNIAGFFAEMDALNILRADDYPRATRCLAQIQAMIARLEARGAAYSADGDVYFAVMKAQQYGKLSGRDLRQQQEGASGRLAADDTDRKRHPFDFALWKRSRPGEPGYPSPWGMGRPGWHIECSAMVHQAFGDTIDLHLGGADLIFPHHENEIAQSETATGRPLANIWLHNGMVNVDEAKMSKSLGNFTTIQALLDEGINPMALRLFVLQAHYRKPLDFTREAMAAAASGWEGLETALQLGEIHGARLGWTDPRQRRPDQHEAFANALDDDLNSSGALAVLFALARPLRALARRLQRGGDVTSRDRGLEGTWRSLVELAGVLGLEAGSTPETGPGTGDDVTIATAIEERCVARRNRDFATADRIRARLLSEGVTLVDRPDGTTHWLRA